VIDLMHDNSSGEFDRYIQLLFVFCELEHSKAFSPFAVFVPNIAEPVRDFFKPAYLYRRLYELIVIG